MSDVDEQVESEEQVAQGEARRRFALAQIRQYPDAALKLQARPVEAFDDELRSLVERMKRLMHDASGALLGAVGVSGDTSDNDETCAVAGIEAAGLKANAG